MNNMKSASKKILSAAMALLMLFAAGCSGNTGSSSVPTRGVAATVVQGNYAEFDWTKTKDSTCFTKVGYNKSLNLLAVTFRDSGETYIYYDFTEDEMEAFLGAESLGSYFTDNIKDQYYFEKIGG